MVEDSEFFYLVNEPYFGGDLTQLGKRAHDQGISMSEDWWRGSLGSATGKYMPSRAWNGCPIKNHVAT